MDFRDSYLYESQYNYLIQVRMEQAARHRLIRLARSGQGRLSFYYPVIERFGRWLIISGHHLRKRYGKRHVISTSQPIQRGV